MKTENADRKEEKAHLEWDKRVPEVVKSLPEGERKRVVSAILSLADDPTPPRSRPLPGRPGWRRLDEGAFCILYTLKVTSRGLVVTVYAVLKDGKLLAPELYRMD